MIATASGLILSATVVLFLVLDWVRHPET